MLFNPYSPHFYQVQKPKSPYLDEIPLGLVPGKQILISGLVLPSADSFQFSLKTPNKVGLLINPKFHLGLIARNSKDTCWGIEERDGPFPFEHASFFELLITVESDRYIVHINGDHIFDYKHRIPINEISFISIDGGVDIHSIVYSAKPNKNAYELNGPALPNSMQIFNAEPGKLIEIVGDVPFQSDGFEIKIQHGKGLDEQNINLFLNVRFEPSGRASAVISHRKQGNWGRDDKLIVPLNKGNDFHLLFFFDRSDFKIAVDGTHLYSYTYRLPIQEANYLTIAGSVDIFNIRQF